MNRRELIGLLGGAAVAWPFAARAQHAEQMRRISLLLATAENDPELQASIGAFLQGLRDLRWIEGRNVQINYRWAAGDIERMHSFAKELVGMRPDVLMCTNTPTAAALRRETESIPIVFVQVSDPIGDGFVASFARPGRNITGLTNYEPTMGGKWLEILRDIAPNIGRVALLFNPNTSPGGGSYYSKPIEAAAASLGVQVIAMPLRDAAEIEPALNAFAHGSNGGLIIVPDSFNIVHREPIIRLAAQHRLPAIYFFRFFATDGGLVSYGADRNDSYRRGAEYVDRILRGARPADLPVEAPTKFELVINVRTARALGLDVPLHLQQLADEVIE